MSATRGPLDQHLERDMTARPIDTSSILQIQLLGGFRMSIGEIERPGSAWRSRKAAALVKVLALAQNHARTLLHDLQPVN
jgi:hypothetical protein